MSNFNTMTFTPVAGTTMSSGTYNAQIRDNMTHLNTFVTSILEPEHTLRPGVYSKTDFRVTHSDGTTSRDFIISAGTAIVPNGKRFLKVESATPATVTVGAAGANPRVDQIALAITTSDESGTAIAAIAAGTATGGATLDNMTGANATYLNPISSTTGTNTAYIKLADVLIPTSGTINATDWRDRRPIRYGDSVLSGTAQQNTAAVTLGFPTLTYISTLTSTRRGTSAVMMETKAKITFSKLSFLGIWTAAGTITALNFGIYDHSGRSLGIGTAITYSATAAGTAFGTVSLPSSITLFPGHFYLGMALGTMNAGTVVLQNPAFDPGIGATPVSTTPGPALAYADTAAGSVLPTYLGTVSTWDIWTTTNARTTTTPVIIPNFLV